MEHLGELQAMFPSLEGDVVAIIMNQCNSNGQRTLNNILRLIHPV